MRSDRMYRVEVQAVSYWKQSQLKGPRAIVHVSTQRSMYNMDALFARIIVTHADVSPLKDILRCIRIKDASATLNSSTADVLHVGTPFYQNGQLQVHIYWQSSTGVYLVHDSFFRCKYAKCY